MLQQLGLEGLADLGVGQPPPSAAIGPLLGQLGGHLAARDLHQQPVGVGVAYCGQELFGIPEQVDRFTTAGKGALTKYNQDSTAAYDSLLICGFPASFNWMNSEHFSLFLLAATGIEAFADKDHILTCGERIFTLEKAFNVREGDHRNE